MLAIATAGPRAAGPEGALPDGLDGLVAERVARAIAAWPTVSVDEQLFVTAIVKRLSADSPVRSLHAMQTDDLYLATACAAGDPGALRAFETSYGPAIARTIASTSTPTAERADVGQIVRVRLLVAPANGGMPRIASYSGRGSLRAWVRVVATREAARMVGRREVMVCEEVLVGALADTDTPEVAYIKRLYCGEFERAFHAAAQALDDRARTLLRGHALDGLSIDQLAARHGVHRATAARWVEAARHTLVAETHREMARRLRLSRGELAGVLRLIRSQVDVTLPRSRPDPSGAREPRRAPASR
jgi:RNA polymerase sigma-70 factor (ECF subfamily)